MRARVRDRIVREISCWRYYSMTTPSIHFQTESKFINVLKTSQWLPAPLSEIFDFFSRPENLQQITPPHLHFTIINPAPIEMKNGLELKYRLKLYGIPLHWTSLIENWNPPYGFTDRQLKGPYTEWVHSHHFRAEGDGTLVEDSIRYKAPGGRLVEKWLIQKDLASIFGHRQQVLTKLFPSKG